MVKKIMKSVLHVGPINSKGGMSRTIQEMISNPPDGWNSHALESHVDGSIFSKFSTWRNSLRNIENLTRDLGVDIIHVHTASDISWMRKRTYIKRSIKLGIPVIVSIHAGNFHNFCKTGLGFFGADVKRLLNKEEVTTVFLTNRSRENNFPWSGGNVRVIPNFISKNVKKDDLEERKFGRLLFIGRDSKEKRVPLAVEIANRISSRGYDTSLVLAGIDHQSRSLRGAMEYANIEPKGWLSEDSVSDLISSSWALIVTSEYEALPMAVIEAMSSGLPVFGSGCIEGIFEDSGFIIESSDPDVWASKIIETLENPASWKKMSDSGPSESTKFESQKVREQWAELYNSLVVKRNS